MDPRPCLIVVAGPTGVGKSVLAMQLAREFGGEIICADSMQVYRYMDIGTAKPSQADRDLVRHHLIDVVNPDQAFNAALYRERARDAIRARRHENSIFWVVGGTGLYIRALIGGLVEGPGASEDLRNLYREEIRARGIEHLYNRLQEKDGEAAQMIHPHDAVRIIRALEVIEVSGTSIVEMQRRHGFGDSPYRSLKIGLREERERLNRKIDIRCDGMIEKGLIDEVKNLLSMGYSASLRPMQSLGYRHVLRFLDGSVAWKDAVVRMKGDTRNYAKRQMTWFRADGEMNWYRPSQMNEIKEDVLAFLSFGCT